MKTATRRVLRVEYPDGMVIDHPGARLQETLAHCARTGGELLGEFEVKFEYPEEAEIASETLSRLGFEATPELVKTYCDNLEDPARLRRILMTLKR